ncbi:hypothetical protein ACVIW2_004871 [Bradyrhizobium huanghuaihaiense]|uniref:hypothetical protein n=1 Tax=Bradyrhizobium huanghuaihaiense TaxID=990078 RepID=UPI0005544A03|nr:hypothetical protein [Bradyrhizobium huanghuaihaiense]
MRGSDRADRVTSETFPLSSFVRRMAREGSSSGREDLDMPEQTIHFDDGAAYEQMMGIWSRSAGEIFL